MVIEPACISASQSPVLCYLCFQIQYLLLPSSHTNTVPFNLSTMRLRLAGTLVDLRLPRHPLVRFLTLIFLFFIVVSISFYSSLINNSNGEQEDGRAAARHIKFQPLPDPNPNPNPNPNPRFPPEDPHAREELRFQRHERPSFQRMGHGRGS